MTDTSLSGTATFSGMTLADLGLLPGTYTYTWTAAVPGASDGSLTVEVTVPEPSTWAMMLIGFAGLGFAGHRASRKGAAAA